MFYKKIGNIYEQFEGFLKKIHLEKADMQASHSPWGQLSNPKIASNFLQGIVLHKRKLNASKASKSWFS